MVELSIPRLPISHRNSSNVQTMSEALRHGISIHAKYLKSAKAMVDGHLVSSLLSCRVTFETGLFISVLVSDYTFFEYGKAVYLPMSLNALDDLVYILPYFDVSDGIMIYQTYHLEYKKCLLNLSCLSFQKIETVSNI